MLGLAEAYKKAIEKQAEDIYEKTIIRKLPTYVKKVALSYPSYRAAIMDALIKAVPHKDRNDLVVMLVYWKFASRLVQMLGKGGICPEAEGRLYRLFIENMATLDVECKLRMRKGTHLEKINVQVAAIGQDAEKRKSALNTIT